MSEWIDIKKRRPEKDGRYLVVEDNYYKWVGVSSMRNGKFDMEILYWQNIPDAPEDKS